MKSQFWNLALNGASSLNDRLFKFVFSLLFILQASLYFIYGKELLYTGSHEQHIAAEVLLGNLPGTPGTLPAIFSDRLLTIQPTIEAFLMTHLGVSFYPIFVFASLLALLFAYFGVFWLGRNFTQSRWGGLFCCVLILWGWFRLLTFGYGIDYNSGMYPGELGISLGLFILGLWSNRPSPWPWVLLGILYDVHITNAAIVSTALGAHFAFLLLYKKLDRTQVFRIFLGILVGVVIAIPEINLIRNVGVSPPMDNEIENWWTWMTIRRVFHLRPWLQNYQLVQLALHYCMLIAGIVTFWPQLKKTFHVASQAGVMCFAITALWIFNWIGVEVFRNPNIACLIFSRGTIYLFPLAGAFLFMTVRHYFALDFALARLIGALLLLIPFAPFHSPRDWALLVGIVLLAMASVFLHGKYPLREGPAKNGLTGVSAFSLAWLTYFCNSEKISQGQWLWGSGFFGIALLIAWRKTLLSRFKSHFVLPVVMLIIFGMIAQSHRVTIRNLLSEPESDWRSLEGLKQWLVTHTDFNTLVLAPPAISCGPYCLGRNALIQSSYIGLSVYIRDALSYERKVMRVVYGVDITDTQQAKDLRLDITGYFERHYQTLKTEDVQRIASEYPTLEYFIAFRNVDDSQNQSPSLQLPLLYQNDRYLVYSTKTP